MKQSELAPYEGQKVNANIRAYSYHEHYTPKTGVIRKLDGTGDELFFVANEAYSDKDIFEITSVVGPAA